MTACILYGHFFHVHVCYTYTYIHELCTQDSAIMQLITCSKQLCSESYDFTYFIFYPYYFVETTVNDAAEEGAVRLVGGTTPLEGRVEIFLFGQWGTVCGRYSYRFHEVGDLAVATVVCHQLGYPRAVGATRKYATFGAGSSPSWYSNVRCTGTEMNLTECSKSISFLGNACFLSEDVEVVCSSEL